MDNPPPNSENPYASPASPNEVEKSLTPISINKPNEPLMEPILISGVISINDALLAMRMAKKSVRYGCWGTLATLIGCFVLCLLLLLQKLHATSLSRLPQHVIDFFRNLSLQTIIIVTISFALSFFVLWRQNKNRSKQAPAAQPQLEGTITEDQFSIKWIDTSAVVKWSAFSKYLSSDSVVVLIYKDSGSNFLFTRNLFQSHHDWDCFLGLLDRKMPRC